MPKPSTREMKINRIYSYLDEIAASEELDEEYIDDLLVLTGEYVHRIERIRSRKME